MDCVSGHNLPASRRTFPAASMAERHTRTGIGLPLLSCRNASSGPHWTCADLRPSLTAYVRLQVEHSSLDCKAIKAYLFHIAARLHSPTSCHEPWTAVCKMGCPSWRSKTRAHELLHERRLNSRHPCRRWPTRQPSGQFAGKSLTKAFLAQASQCSRSM